ncbi:hypothetical protein WJX84_003691 [Apatococcus fuscideae]|uniref:BZIP domain-containing protein n=1 Tax=Apatococcus fuscideae TaxID=2026836 RepID=A0AAW1SVH6_9CHLO
MGPQSFDSGLDPTPFLGGQLPEAAATTTRPSSAGTKRALQEIAVRSQSLPAQSAEVKRTGSAGQKTRERNKRAQQTFRQRQKARAEQQEDELNVAASRIAELEEQVSALGQLLAVDSPDLAVASITQLPGESPIAARIRASTCALQLEKHLMVVREHKLISSIQKAGRPSPAHSSGLASSYPIMARSDVLASRKARLQAVKPCEAWAGCTPVPLEQLYSCILEGRLDLSLPLANRQAPESTIFLSRLVAMPVQQHLKLQASYHASLASAAPFCRDPESLHAKHFQAVMGEAMALLAVFSECLPEQFLACQSINMLDGTTRRPPQAFEDLKVAASTISLDATQLLAAHALFTPVPDRISGRDVADAQRGRHPTIWQPHHMRCIRRLAAGSLREGGAWLLAACKKEMLGCRQPAGRSLQVFQEVHARWKQLVLDNSDS